MCCHYHLQQLDCKTSQAAVKKLDSSMIDCHGHICDGLANLPSPPCSIPPLDPYIHART